MKKNVKVLIISLAAITIIATGCQSSPTGNTPDTTTTGGTTEATTEATTEKETKKSSGLAYGASATVDGQLYSNPDLNITIQFPEGLMVLDYEATVAYKKDLIGAAAFANDQKGRDAKVMDYLVFASNDDGKFDLLAYNAKQMLKSLNVTTEDEYIKAVADQISQSYTQAGMKPSVGEAVKKTIGSTEFNYLKVVVANEANGISISQFIFSFQTGEVLVMGNYTSQDENGEPAFDEIISGLSI